MKRKLRREDLRNIKGLLDKIEEAKTRASGVRDELQGYYSELEDIVDSFDTGVDYINNGLRSIRDGVDKMSELI